jgi:hypothetical protein
MGAAADSHPPAGAFGEELPLYGLPPDVECQRSMVPWQRMVQSSIGPEPQGTVTIESTEAGLDHRRDAESVRVVTVIPPSSLSRMHFPIGNRPRYRGGGGACGADSRSG